MSKSRRYDPVACWMRWLLAWFFSGLLLGCHTDCTYDTQCSEGAICMSGTCRTTCTATEACGGNSECVGKWSSSAGDFSRVPICEDSVCGCDDPAATCVTSGQQRACVVLDEQCSSGSACEDEGRCGALGLPGCVCESGDCGPRCSRDAQCGDDLVCDQGRCSHVTCEGDADCDNGRFCGVDIVAGSLERVCLSPGDEAAGTRCSEHTQCQSRLCGGDAAKPVCLDLCEQDADCQSSNRCVFGGPLTGTEVGVCLPVEQCDADETPLSTDSTIGCTLGQACQDAADCLNPLSCIGGSCACTDCGGDCETDADCGDAFTCQSGVCRLRPTCADEADCESGQTCVPWLGRDVDVKYCVDTGPLALGTACSRPEQCETGFCNDVCTLPCEASKDCPDSMCEAGKDGRGYCSLDTCPCRDTEICGGGLCAVSQACVRNADCEPDEACVNGICLRQCTRGADCRAGHDCVRLMDSNEYCIGGQERCNCSSDEICIAGECRTSDPCDADSDCANSTCVDGHCFDTCEKNADCTGGLECVARTLGGRLVRGCAPKECNCDDENAWCLGTPAGFGSCFRDDNCDACGEHDGYACARLDTPVSWQGGAISRACRCEDPSVCGAVCESSADCPVELDLECAPFGRCAPVGSCRSTGDCQPLWDCVRDPGSAAALGTCSRADCGCAPDASCVSNQGQSECVVGAGCSVLKQDCPQGFECDPGLGLCTCSDRSICAPRCERNSDCVPSQLCQDGICEPVECSLPDDCPKDSVCGGTPSSLSCFQPGTTEDGGLCKAARDCRSGYCFAGNSCALLCSGTADCPGKQKCQRVDPEAFPSELPVCHSGSTLCDGCRDDQYCNNDPNAPRCLPECRDHEDCETGRVCVDGVCTQLDCASTGDCPPDAACLPIGADAGVCGAAG